MSEKDIIMEGASWIRMELFWSRPEHSIQYTKEVYKQEYGEL